MEEITLLSKVFEILANNNKGSYVFLSDIKTGYSRWSKECVEEFGLPSDRIEDAGLIWAEHVHPSDRARYDQSLEDVFSGRTDSHDLVYRARNKYGEYVAVTCRGKVIRDDDNTPLFFAGTIINHGIASEYDNVTNLYTKEKLIETLADYKEDKQRYNILFIGIYNFIDINNVYGYEFGNKVIKNFAEKLLEYTDDAEVFSAGGTKFAVVSTELKLSQLKEIYEELADYGRYSITVDGTHVAIMLGASCTEVTNFAVDEHTVFSNGLRGLEESMYEKHGEINAFSNSLMDKSHERLVLLNALRNSILEDCDGFSLVFQPVIDAETESLKGAEALVRWKKDPYGNVSPADFIAWLEDDPLFYDLGLWIAENAMRFWKENVLTVRPDLNLSINLSYTQLERSNFRKDFANLIKELDFPADRLKVELTERCTILDKHFLRNEIIFMKSQGIDTIIDDFGTGFSAMELLLVLPVSGIKIDRSFVSGIAEDIRKQAVAEAIITCAQKMGLHITVEGVESGIIRDAVKSFGASSYQGYFYSVPVPIEDFVKLPFM
ncbi:EAL domain-containing protein [Butyrivibrio sp. VCB2006]|uniref:EAL domain-containing protein n=1 Tax=Butyrivibrio sp. VCB2006 TaxID=1280679 RepID=UPI0004261670|nr:EAL domain-containing protein [Butyrivibrio sp. VCB2006]